MTTHTGDADIAAVGAVLGDRSRCRILMALADGRCLPASTLATEAGIASSTASAHLAKLVDAGFISVQHRGRYRYYALAGPGVADLIERLAQLAPTEPITSLRAGTRAAALRRARTCYDHLAGRLGVAVTDAMRRNGWLDGITDEGQPQPTRVAGAVDGITAVLTLPGRRALTQLRVELPSTDGVRCCVDWTEQRPHLGGAHGRAITDRMLALGWIRRTPKGRAVHLTEEGRRGLAEHFGCGWAEDAQPSAGSGVNVG